MIVLSIISVIVGLFVASFGYAFCLACLAWTDLGFVPNDQPLYKKVLLFPALVAVWIWDLVSPTFEDWD